MTIHINVYVLWAVGILCGGAILALTHFISYTSGHYDGMSDAIEQNELPLSDQEPWFRDAVQAVHLGER